MSHKPWLHHFTGAPEELLSRQCMVTGMASDESFKRPGTVPFKWEVQPGIPKQQQQQQHPAAGAAGDDVVPAATTPRLALPPAARVGAPSLASASCRHRASSSVAAPLSLPALAPQTPSHHRRSLSARFATSLALMPLPFTRRGRGTGEGGRAGAAKDDAAGFCLLYAEKQIA